MLSNREKQRRYIIRHEVRRSLQVYNGVEGIDFVTCQICGKRGLYVDARHLKTRHNLTKEQYLLQFPNAYLISNKKAEAQSVVQAATINIDPIPTYLEGYAYDSTGAVIANATVGIYLTFSSKPYYETKADDQGYFKISSEHLPRMAYELRYTTPTGVIIKTTTSQFIGQNQQYLTQAKVNLNVYKNGQGKTITTPLSPTTKPGVGPTTPTPTNNLLVLIGGLIFLLVAVIGILVIYLKKNKQPETTQSSPLQ